MVKTSHLRALALLSALAALLVLAAPSLAREKDARVFEDWKAFYSETMEKTVVAQTTSGDGSTLAVCIDRNAGGVIVLTFTNHASLKHLSSSKYTCDMVIDGRKHYRNMVLDVYRKGKKGLAIYPGLSDAILEDFVKGRKVAVISIVKGKPLQTTFSLQGFTMALGYALDLHKKYLQ
ncbi:hypothetical protein B5F76_12350 [Desulfovibrio sp. An276]|uniref:hypothetical protein n=1 Tax=Desulfovibrio sp. An276 TaxID=1965618 RepID=UPI000B38714D|nr:hypothetical protein [Desulfovibrio sp. An276]OUO50201.1 hypothetical protein B5F76_12350 [Desulfovibrio sp. An276]